MSSEPFAPLELPKKNMGDSNNALYLVYKDKKEFVTVQAGNAQAAILASGIEKPIKVTRQDLSACTVISLHGICNNGIDLNKGGNDADHVDQAEAAEPVAADSEPHVEASETSAEADGGEDAVVAQTETASSDASVEAAEAPVENAAVDAPAGGEEPPPAAE